MTEAERPQDGLLCPREGVLVVGTGEQLGQGLGEALLEERSPALGQRLRFRRYRQGGEALAHEQCQRLGHRGGAVGGASQHTAALQLVAQGGADVGSHPREIAGAERQAASVLQGLI